MLKIIKYSIFALISLFWLSAATAMPRLYYSEESKPFIVKSCIVNSIYVNNDFTSCRVTYIDFSQKLNIQDVVTPDENNAFISSSTGRSVQESLGGVFKCGIEINGKPDYLKFVNCRPLNYRFNQPKKMVYSLYSKNLYITESTDVVVCTNLSESPTCTLANANSQASLMGGPTSIVLSENEDNAYIGQPNKNYISVCNIDKLDIPYRRFSNCSQYGGDNSYFKKPIVGAIGFFAESAYPKKFLYTLNQQPSQSNQEAYSCMIQNRGMNIGNCYGSPLSFDNVSTSYPVDMALSPYQTDFKNGTTVFIPVIAGMDLYPILRCNISFKDNEYDCTKTTIETGFFNVPVKYISIQY